MKVLNLVYPEKSEIKFHDGLGNVGKTAKFPDGQQNIVINSDLEEDSIKSFWAVPGSSQSAFKSNVMQKYTIKQVNNIVLIKSRLNNWLDLELIACAVASLRELGVEEIHLYVPYILGGRSDRKFGEGGNNYLKDVICPIINSLNFKSVTCVDPHSDVLEACIKGFRKESNSFLVDDTISRLYGDSGECKWEDRFILISPDAGASKTIYKLAEQIGYKGDIITCSKDRGVDGKLTKTVVPIKINGGPSKIGYYMSKDYIIIDDICDGGATFINISKELKNQGVTGKIYLIVTHGIFSKGIKELSQYFDGIYCTNSYKDITNIEFDGINTKDYKGFLKQLNLF
ncbi:PrsA phosphoribosylpyrophosphate synthetase [Leptolyngbya phage Lbo-JY46]